ncbi:MAG: signal peptide peptidase SppA [Bdellovibrionota bacterium]
MKTWSFRKKFVLGLVVTLLGLFIYSAATSYFNNEDIRITRNEILHLEINGIIMNGKKFLSQLKKYKKDESVKAIVIEINSPGGAVGPSQELYYEILRAKEETKKPVVCVSTGLIASGGYYSALACDKLVVAPGTMIGSIGVIMEFANLEKLYDWAKVQRYTITSGKFKDSGSEYRAMRDDERQLFQEMINEVYDQFKNTVVEARNLPVETVNEYADGRVMTGATAVKLKFSDAIGTYEDAVKMAAKMANLGDDYKIFKPKKEKFNFFDVLAMDDEEDDLNSLSEVRDYLKGAKGVSAKAVAGELAHTFFKTKYLNQPLFLMPGYWE